ncbi:DUF3566 domain-containing protein [Paenarthrobacter sp. DKR-5]|uniref:DUF3566 domain-containing protein n=1 Tax=Paenarthrobacter sp. DKR-5 TaxID=2835535 RepID=UPI001BDD20A8|nr:DUF3566 domain-containing protein [Paenarthrobacter sp. DKR-5]MBT1004001.1 DUF3566 domain-containing protein [Paenarthrobacter sp. DKR-5]
MTMPPPARSPAPAGTAQPRFPDAAPPAPAGVRRARLVIGSISPFKVLRTVFLVCVALGAATVIALVLLWLILTGTGLIGQFDAFLSALIGAPGGTPVDLQHTISVGQVAAFATALAVVNTVLLTTLSTLAAVLYNACAKLVGGIGATLTDG